jgi:hypothetical protein
MSEFTAEQAATLARFEAAPAPESVRERVARAMHDADGTCFYGWGNDCPRAEKYHHLAEAALDVLRGPATEAEKAVERVLALADEHRDCCGYVTVGTLRLAIQGDR